MKKGLLQNRRRKKGEVRSPKGFPNLAFCVKIVGVKQQSQTQGHYTTYERDGQQVIKLNSEIILPENAPVRLTNAQLEELDDRQLYRAYSPKGRKSAADPRVAQQLFQNEPGRHVHADEGRPYAQRAAQARL